LWVNFFLTDALHGFFAKFSKKNSTIWKNIQSNKLKFHYGILELVDSEKFCQKKPQQEIIVVNVKKGF